jgi:signal recognition particle subunit SRP54
VSQLVAQLFQMRAQMQKLMSMVQGQEAIAGMGDLMDSLKAEEKVTMSDGVDISEHFPWRGL